MESNNKHKKTTSYKSIERITVHKVPWYSQRLIQEHLMRYEYARKFIKNKVIVDIACGTGYGSYILAQAGAKHIYAIDIDKKALQLAKDHYTHPNITFIYGNAQKIPLKKDIADVLISFETIEHLKKPELFISEIYRLLKSGGVLILSTPNRETSYEDNPFHLKEFTLDELRELLSKFRRASFYGQRPVNKSILFVYKKLMNKISFSPLKFFFRFRPWEKMIIEHIHSPAHTGYLYFLVKCKK